jgi:fatty acid desaturase
MIRCLIENAWRCGSLSPRPDARADEAEKVAGPELIPAEEVRAQRWKFYAAVAAWPAYLVLIPWAFARLGVWSLPLLVFPGSYLFAWNGYLMHESWHKLVPGLPNELLFTVYSWMLLTDPQLYRLLHGLHHSEVNTWADLEFHPVGEIRGRGWTRLYNAAEIVLGSIFVQIVTTVVVPRDPRYRVKYRRGSLLASLAAWIVIFGGAAWAAVALFGVRPVHVVVPVALTVWLGSLLLHHNQLVEHGNLIVAGSWEERNARTRNLRRQTLLERLFVFLSHHDSEEHIHHHTMARVYTRPFPGRVAMPAGAVYITLGGYLGVLGDMLAGRPSAA